MATFSSSLKSKLIYVFAIDDERHRGALKIGETTIDEDDGSNLFNNSEVLNAAADKRIRQYTKTAGIAYNLLYTEISIFMRSGMIMSFNDKQVHKVLENSGVEKKEFEGVRGADEWYCCDLETVKKAIAAVKSGETSLHPSDVTKEHNPVILRPEQRAAVDKTRKRFQKHKDMLWNAKMRFGKTISALQLIKEEGYVRTLILTHRPVVDDGWFKDYELIFYDRKEYRYISKTKIDDLDEIKRHEAKGGKYMYFASMQDLRGSELVGGKFDKNDLIFSTDWDLVIIDEAHEGTKTELGQNVIREVRKPNTKLLQLSGTPFNLFDDYSEEEIYTWDYVMEQRAKQAWATDNPYEPNPYASLPAINIYTYDLGNLMSEYVEDEKAFNFREFFRTHDDGTFIHDADVDRFLNLLCKDDKDSLYPYSNEDFRRTFRHTLWVVPGVKAAKALSAKLKDHPTFGMFETVNVAGNGDEEEERAEALKKVNKAIGSDPSDTFTITLSCGRLTTGVSVKPWTAVFMLSGSFSTSAAQYMQTIFRVQTPFTINGRMKEQCYAFDFAPDRTLRVLAEAAKVSTKAGKQTESDRRILGDFLNFCPIISIEGSQMKNYDVNKMMSQLKRAQIEKVVQGGFEDVTLYNDELLKLSDIDLKEFANLKKVIGSTKAMVKTSDIDVNKQGFTNEEYEEVERIEKKPKKERTPEEEALLAERKEKNNQRKAAISILRGISIRMPLLIYGAELKSEDEEITIDNFATIVDDQSWEEFMPKGVDKETFEKFKKYYDPDIFREAGKRIREMAKAADKFTIEERIERIGAIFNTFRNPDKETVLTPWRVVNMHMSDTLGGWCFYDEHFKETLSVPRYVRQREVTDKVFRPDSLIMEINSKSGLYPLYVAYNVYRSRVEEAKANYGEVSHAFALSLWDTTIENNILVVCKTPMAASITKRTLAGFRNARVNAKCYFNLIESISDNPTLVVNTLRDGKHYWGINDNECMKIDAIVGNPPYQVMGDNNNRSLPIYHLFVDIAKVLTTRYSTLIIPARWYTASILQGDFTQRMLKDSSISKLVDFSNATDCFPSVEIKGGICYYLADKKHNSECQIKVHHADNIYKSTRFLKTDGIDAFVRFTQSLSIVEKVKSHEFYSLADIVSSQNPFGFNSKVVGNKRQTSGDVRILSKFRTIGYINPELITLRRDYVDKWKVMTPIAGEGGTLPHKVTGRPFVSKPNECCNGTYMVIGPFNNQEESNNAVTYLNSKFARFLVSVVQNTQNTKSESYRLVPLQDFTDDSDIDWTKSINDIDKQLYKKYKLTEEEIQFIESMIKPM